MTNSKTAQEHNGTKDSVLHEGGIKGHEAPTFDDIFKTIKSYGWYQIIFLLTIQYASIPNACNSAGGFFSLGGLVPTYTCIDNNQTIVFNRKNINRIPGEACRVVRSCQNLTVENAWYSLYQEFEWMCVPPYLMPTLASLLPFTSIIGYLAGGHLADHLGRKWLTFTGIASTLIGGILCAVTPSWKFYIALVFFKGLINPMFYGSAFALCMESVGSKWRLIQSFSFQWSLGYIFCFLLKNSTKRSASGQCCFPAACTQSVMNSTLDTWFAGLMAYVTRHWRIYYAVVNGFALPVLLAFIILQESPRWLVQKHKYRRAAKVVNKIAKINGRKNVKYTDMDMKEIELSSRAKDHHYNIFHLFSQWKLAKYCIAQICTGICINTVTVVILFNVQDLAGSPFLNIACMGLLRLWTPAAALLLERYAKNFGRKPFLIATQGTVCFCFTAMIVIYAVGLWKELHILATALALIGYAVEIGLVWVAYKTYTTELFPTVVRTIALNTFSLSSLVGSALAPQLVFLQYYWQPLPYAGAAALSMLSIVMGLLILPETRGQPMPDSLEEVKDGRLKRIDTRTAGQMDKLLVDADKDSMPNLDGEDQEMTGLANKKPVINLDDD